MRFVFLGPPGVGKGTQAENVSIQKNIPHVSSGNLLRVAIKSGSEIGIKAKVFIDKGLLVPDSLIVSMVVDEIGLSRYRSGFILDGFPRNLLQAEILDSTLDEQDKKIDKVFYFTASEEVIIERIAGRRICTSCDMHFHQLYKPPLKENICDKCGSNIFQRKDDNPETVLVRLKVYHEQTEDLIEYYKRNKKLIEINCNGSVSEINEKILSVFDSFVNGKMR
ncbi:MAG: adenylate kinase [Candidatus Scalindua sp. AMX11]|nr:MAG: adenylate kinase [Candidatus Scalindua sp.]NOG85507.1 adenylate kinase [Planctomycetota bacterium]RZV90244.1 MAG: adenylate kinase [Candidatus Scalindua sp. SCAELEC01]TDE64655.1 MAG: adenylate kinase [Candidatus Scalindua sp. AMX11]GJQ57508.1 MAG: adenylate kinase [Candidatus Scalindua sp.]